jgi:hypothetical protein
MNRPAGVGGIAGAVFDNSVRSRSRCNHLAWDGRRCLAEPVCRCMPAASSLRPEPWKIDEAAS